MSDFYEPGSRRATTASGSSRGRDWDSGVKLVMGAIALASGAFFTYVFMPDALSDPGSLQVVALVMTISLLIAPLVWALKNPLLLIGPVAIMSLGLVYWILLDLLQALYTPEVWSIEPVYSAFVTISLFAFGMYCGGLLFTPSVPRWLVRAASYEMSPRQLLAAATVATALSFLRFAIPSDFDLIQMLRSLGGNRWSAPWARGELGGWDAFLDHFTYFGYVLPAIAVLMYRLEGVVTFRTLCCIAFALVISAFLAQSGGRRIIGAIWGAAVILWIITSSKPIRTMLTAALVFVPLLLGVMQLMLENRTAGLAYADENVVEERSGVTVDDNFNRMAQTISLVPSEYPHVGMSYLLWVAVRPVPRVLWADKPVSHGFDLPAAIGKYGVSLTTSVVGEAYLAFSYAGCLAMGLLYGYLGALLSRILAVGQKSPSSYVIYSAGLFALFVGLRSAIELVLFSYAVFAWIALVFILRRVRRL